MKMMQGGMEIWIDDKAKNNKSTGIKFPVGGGNMPMRAGGANRQEPKELRQQLRLKLLTMELTGFKDGLNGPQSVYLNVQVKPVIDRDDKDKWL